MDVKDYQSNVISREVFDTAQICIDGHVITPALEEFPEHGQPFCDECGKKTIIECEFCHVKIKGYKPDGHVGYRFEPQLFCDACGKPYPWTMAKKIALSEFIKELNEIKDADKEILYKNLDDLLLDTPRQPVAIIICKRILQGVKKENLLILRDIIIRIGADHLVSAFFSSPVH